MTITLAQVFDDVEIIASNHGLLVSSPRPGNLDIKADATSDFVRLVTLDEGCLKVVHFTHNEVIKGEATFTGTMLAGVVATVLASF